ncbi:MAG TPA: YqgE/AlgH family protein [Dongiaceae bacterium]|nr:YqgE/AlgH family protein [Dongiaceae bacterium]
MEKPMLHQGFMTGQLLVAMPQLGDYRFSRSVIYVCVHTPDGAMGIVVNKLVDSLTFPDMLEQLGIRTKTSVPPIFVRHGGPVETGRGFVIHSTDYIDDGTMRIDDHIGLTATIDILKYIANGEGPRHRLLALGYAGWDAGQLEAEIQNNAWMTVPADDDLLFDDKLEDKWVRSFHRIGVNPQLLSGHAGHA